MDEKDSSVDLKKLEAELINVQRSSGTLWPIFIKLHNWLRMKSRWYYKWHLLPYAKVAHVVLLFMYLASLTTGVFFTQVNLVHAATITWDGGGTDGTCGGGVGDGNKWSCAANWSTDTVPTSADAVVFNATSTKDATVDASFAGVITSLSINSGYTGTITLARSLQTTSTFTQGAGTFTMGSQNLEVDAGFTITAGTFNANTGTVTFAGSTATLSCNNITFNLVSFTGQTGAKTVNSNCSLPLGASPTVPNSVTLSGTLSGSGTLTSTTGTLTILSSAILSGFSGFSGGGISITGAATVNFSSYNPVTLSGAFTMTTGTFTAPSGTMTIGAALSLSGSAVFNANNGTVVFNGGSATLACNNATFNLVSFAGQTNVKTVNSDCSLPLGASPTIPQTITLNGTLSGTGTLTESAGTLTLNAGATLSGFSGLNVATFTNAGATTNLSTYSSFVASAIVTLSSGMLTLPSGADLNSNLTISAGTFNAPSGNMTLAGALTISGTPTFNANGGTFTFDGAAATLSCNNVTFNVVSFTGQTSTKTVNSNCSLPLGAGPTIPNSITLNGTLSGTGSLTTTTGTFTLNSGASLSGFSGLVTNGFLTVAGATLNLGSYTTVDLNNTFTISSGTFTAPTGTMTLAGAFVHTAGGTFNHNNGTVVLDGGAVNSDVNVTETFNNLTIAATNGVNKAIINNDSLIVLGTLTLTDGNLIQTTPPAAGTIQAQGNIIENDTFDGGNGVVAINGTSDQTFTGNATTGTGSLPMLNINKTSGTLFLAGTIRTIQNWTYTTGTINSTTNNSTVVFACALLSVITGSHSLNNVIFAGDINTQKNTIFSGTTITTLGTLTLSTGTIETGTVDAQGDIVHSANFEGGSGLLTISGNATRTVGLSGGGRLPGLTLNAPNVTLNNSNSGTVGIDGNLTLTQGIFNGQSGDLAIGGNYTQSGGTFTAPSGTFTIAGTMSRTNGTFTHNNGTLRVINGTDRTFSPSSTLHNLTIDDGVIGYWKLDEGSGASANDSSPFGNTGRHVNGPTYSSDTPNLGFANTHSMNFDGANDDTYVGSVPLVTADTSISMWFKTSDTQTIASRMADLSQVGANAGGLQIIMNDTGKVFMNSAGGPTNLIITSTSYNNGQWHHAAVTRLGSTYALYVDGALIGSTPGTVPTYTRFAIGNTADFSSGRVFKGLEDDVRVYNRALSGSEIAALAAGAESVASSNTHTQTLGSNLDLDGALTLNSGSLDVSTSNYNINIAGDWTNNTGTFIPRAGTVTFDGGDQLINSSNTFYNVMKTVTSANTLTFEAGSTQTITGTLNLQGTSGNLLDLRSSTSGNQWNIDPQGPRTLGYLDVKDSTNRNATVINAQHLNVFDSGNNTGWLFDVAPDLSLKTIGGGKFTDKTTKFTYYGQHPVFVGTGTAGAVVTVKSGTTTWCTATIAADGTWSCRTTPTLAYDTDYPVTISAAKDNHTTTLKTFTLTTRVATTTPPSEDLPTNAPSLTPNGSPLTLTINGETYTTQIYMTPDGTLVVGELRVRITNPNGTPLVHTNVTLHSDPQTVTTNAKGIATFANVPIGDHTLTYRTASNQQVTQPLTLQVIKDANGVPINVTVELKTATVVAEGQTKSRIWEGVVAILLIIVALLLGLIYKSRFQRRGQTTH